MKNDSIIVCQNCNTENPYFQLNCIKCNYFLRDKIPNINIGEILISLIESPMYTFKQIIFSENKNYVSLLLLFLSIRFLILSRFISVPSLRNDSDFNLLFAVVYFLISTGVVLFIIVFLTNYILKKLKIFSRTKDVFSVIIYSFVPSLSALFILYPIELALFGKYLFSNNPYAFSIKENVFYFLAAFEIFLIIWSFILHIKAIRSLKVKIKASLLISLLNYFIIIGYLLLSKNIFI